MRFIILQTEKYLTLKKKEKLHVLCMCGYEQLSIRLLRITI